MEGKKASSRGRILKIVPFLAVVAAIAIALVACGTPQPASEGHTTINGSSYGDKGAITTSDATTSVTAEQWADVYPNEYNSMQLNANHEARMDYLAEKDYLADIYEGTPFSKDYMQARGHTYDLEDVLATERIGEKSTVACFGCKGSYYPKAELEALQNGDMEWYWTKFLDVSTDLLEPISCYDCHLNSPGNATAVRSYYVNAFPKGNIEFGTGTSACGQCHNEYYFDAETNAVMLPPGMVDPRDMLEYYNSIDFVDYTNPSTGTPQLKAQHPELQMYTNNSVHFNEGLTCVDCHMERLTDVNGNTYTSHEIVNPLESEVIQQTVCKRCHEDVDAQIQMEVALSQNEIALEDEVGANMQELCDALAEASESGLYTEEELNEVRELHRTAMWYWDFVFVENSNGFHNYELCEELLNLSQSYIDQAMALLNK